MEYRFNSNYSKITILNNLAYSWKDPMKELVRTRPFYHIHLLDLTIKMELCSMYHGIPFQQVFEDNDWKDVLKKLVRKRQIILNETLNGQHISGTIYRVVFCMNE